jgi:hypothetical protein
MKHFIKRSHEKKSAKKGKTNLALATIQRLVSSHVEGGALEPAGVAVSSLLKVAVLVCTIRMRENNYEGDQATNVSDHLPGSLSLSGDLP